MYHIFFICPSLSVSLTQFSKALLMVLAWCSSLIFPSFPLCRWVFWLLQKASHCFCPSRLCTSHPLSRKLLSQAAFTCLSDALLSDGSLDVTSSRKPPQSPLPNVSCVLPQHCSLLRALSDYRITPSLFVNIALHEGRSGSQWFSTSIG